MQVFYDAEDSNQVQAIYSGDTQSSVWSSFSKIEVTDPAMVALLNQHGRDCRLTITDSEVTDVTSYSHPDDHSLASNKIKRKVSVDTKTKELLCCAYCENVYSAANTAIETIVDGGQTLKTNIDAAADQSALDAITDTRQE